MGSAFASNLLSKRNEVHVYNRNKERLRGLVAKGAVAHPSPVELAKSVDKLVRGDKIKNSASTKSKP